MSAFEAVWSRIVKFDEDDFFYNHDNNPEKRVEDLDYSGGEDPQYFQGTYDENILSIPGMTELMQDLQSFATGLCLDEVEERLILAQGLLERGWSKNSMKTFQQRRG